MQTAFEALESMRKQLSSEYGKYGIRVVTLRTGGVPESIPASFAGRHQLTKSLEDLTMLGKAATLEDVGDVAAFVASDKARTMTAATVNVSAGALID
jgi:enoyl-[acyl-carrier-protein] reductase (NADH)